MNVKTTGDKVGKINHLESVYRCLYFTGLLVLELFWLVLGAVWVVVNYEVCADLVVLKRILFGNFYEF